ncbi:MAG TPA: epoxyalkane--coenzyme M transferase [Caulobacteraceae bacterium]|nr:epoxyalkane--coenzyme M transferase [Caulobacteraceae bacterium]
MRASQTRILTTHTGSLPRAPKLAQLHTRRFAGEPVDEAEFAAQVAAGVAQAIAAQARVGVDIGNNGEAPRDSYVTYVRERLTGLGGRSAHPMMADMARYEGFMALLARGDGGARVNMAAAPQAVGPVAYVTGAIEAECAQLTAALKTAGDPFVEAFVSSPSPGLVALAVQNAHYPSLEEYLDAVAAALAVEYRAIVEAGFLLQIDAPDLAMERHAQFAGRPLAEFIAFIRLVVSRLNGALAGVPAERVRLHVCWGNYEGPHDLDVGLDAIWPEIRKAKVGALMLSLANPRHAHELRCLAGGAFPAELILAPGVIDTTTNYVEHPEVVAARIVAAAEAIGDPTRVIAGTDCGFESATGFGAVAPDVAWAKLESLTAGARLATERLFGRGAVR